MPASKRAKKIRTASEFDVSKLQSELKHQDNSSGFYSWTIPAILSARNDQLVGNFYRPAQLAKHMRTDDALFTAYQNRLKPQQSIGVELIPARGARSRAIAMEAEALFGSAGVGIRHGALNDITGDLANHGVAIGYNVLTPREDGSRVDFEMRHWPLENVRWDSAQKCLVTKVQSIESLAGREKFAPASEVPIIHGDGRWVIFSAHETEPWTQEACILPAAIVWASHAYGIRDWNRGSASHGNAKVVGTLPEGVSTDSDEGVAFLALLKAIHSSDTPVGIKPFGAGLDYLANSSKAYQVWVELVANRLRAAARIYCGTDAFLGPQGDAPGYDVTKLFGVSVTIVTGDLREAIEPAIQTGLIEPWTAVNFGDSTLAPFRSYMIPDQDADAVRESFSKRQAAFNADVKSARENGYIVDQEYVGVLARRYDVPEPRLEPTAPPIAPAKAE